LDIGAWLLGLGLQQYEPAFRANDIDADVLRELTDADLERLGVASLGHRKKLLKAIQILHADAHVSLPVVTSSRIEAPAPEISAERRQLTVLFCDLVGSTALAARLDPEDLRELVAAYRRVVTVSIERFGGFVAMRMIPSEPCALDWS
jgi:hypothetical protein